MAPKDKSETDETEVDAAEDASVSAAPDDTVEAEVSASEAVDEDEPGKPVKPRGRKRRGAWRVFTATCALGLAFLVAVIVVSLLSMMGRTVALPEIAVERIERQLNAQMDGPSIRVRHVQIGLHDSAYRPTVDLKGVSFWDEDDKRILALPSLRTKLDTSELLLGRLALETLELDGGLIRLERDENGSLQLALGADLAEGAEIGSIGDMLAIIDRVFADEALRELEEVRAQGITLQVRDRRDGRTVTVRDGAMQIVNTERLVAGTVRFDLSMDAGIEGSLVLSLERPKGIEGARFQAQFQDISTRDLAGQVAALNWLGAVDAPVSGALSTEIGDAEGVLALAGTLDIGKGVLRPAEQAKPVHFNSAKTYVRFERATGRLHLDSIELDAPEMRLRGSGHADLMDFAAGIPQTLLGQLRFTDIKLDPEGIFENPVTFASGALDIRYRPQALDLDVGQLVLENEGAQIVTNGAISVEEKGWAVSLDSAIGEIEPDKLMALWPTSAVRATRDWLTTNVNSGKLQRAAAALRLTPGEPINSSVTFNFQNADVQFIKTLPPIRGGQGFASISSNGFFLKLERGGITLPERGLIDASGSIMEIRDLSVRHPLGEFDLALRATIPDALALLDEKPFEFLQKSDLTPDIVTGRADISAQISFPLIKALKLKDIEYQVAADLMEVRSETLIEGRVLASDAMTLAAGDGRLSITGAATLDDIPLNVTWSRTLGEEADNTSRVEGTIELSQRALRAFNVALPEGSVSGASQAQIAFDLVKGEPPLIKLTSDLRGLAMRIDALGWSKGRNTGGKLDLEVVMGEVPDIRTLSVEAAGLTARGDVVLRPGGGFERAIFRPLRVAGKLNSTVEVIGRGANRPVRLVVQGGTIDVRKFGVTSGRPGGGGPPLELAVERVIITDSIALDSFRGKFSNDRGLDGNFTGRLNGQTQVNGVVVPTNRGLAFRVQSQNGGGVLRSSGVFRNASGGALDLTLQPNGRPGQFNGSLKITNTRVKKAPALADLLSALSVVGLLEQLSGDGILFGNVQANFLLSSQGITLRNSSAVGASMGISMEGVYDTERRRMDMQGVVSPIYAVNGLFGALFSPRRGEGLFGFNYRLRGAADNPQVQVNPLSVLTPGVFREIFRQPPPRLQN